MKCVVCGKEFTPARPWQKYCSCTCRRKANRTKEKEKFEDGLSEAPVIREFHCKKCGTLVQVRDKRDLRRTFCCQKCEKYYWKHSHKKPTPAKKEPSDQVVSNQ